VPGCDAARYGAYLLAPSGSTVKVPAEFPGLAGRSVAVVVYADMSVQYEYPYARLEVSMVVASELKQHVPDLRVVSPRRVIAYQDQNIHWQSMDRTRLGRLLGADNVLYISLDEYSMREPGSLNLFRGRIRAQAMVYDCSKPERSACIWRDNELSVLYPANAPTGEPGQDDLKIRYQTEKIFAEMLVKKFYDHEVPKYK